MAGSIVICDHLYTYPGHWTVCDYCGDHKGLVRCYCGWSRSDRNDRVELEVEED